jgi:uncharacterized iron-regulated membrane protein
MTHSVRIRMRRWHRSAGALAAIGVLLLVVTGMLLNHAPSLGLDQRPVRADWVLDRYGIQIAAPMGYFVAPFWISVSGGQLYVDANAAGTLDQLRGAATLEGMIFAGGGDALVVLDGEGHRIDQLDRASLPGAIDAITARTDRVLVETGGQWYASDSSLLAWTPSAAPDAVTGARPLPVSLARAVVADARSRQLNWERVLLDLHSGRLMGAWGPWVIDVFALLFALLAISGFWLWLRSRYRPRA